MTTRAALLRDAVRVLAEAGINGAERDARVLMRWIAGVDGAGLHLILDQPPCKVERARWEAAVAQRARRAPLSHITGQREFWGRSFQVDRHVLDPRPETEILIAEALREGPFRRILDLGTGSGCILVTLLSEWEMATGLGTDSSSDALRVARMNAKRHGVEARADFNQTNWFDGLAGSYDLIVSNPPYVAEDEMQGLAPEVREHEPRQALTPGGDGLDAYRALAAGARCHLSPGGRILLEIGPSQADAVSDLLSARGLSVQGVVPDFDKRPRVVVAGT